MKTFSDFGINIPAGSAGEIRTLCPKCSADRKKHNIKCLSVNTDKGTWFCHHCSWAGGLNDNKIEKVYKCPDYQESTYSNLPHSVSDYFTKRGISGRVLAENKIGYGSIWMPQENMEVSAIQFPYLKNGKVINIKYRDGKKNFRQAKDAEKCLYRFDAIAEHDEDEPLIICEGEIDTLSVLSATDYNKVCSIPDGAPSAGAKSYTTKFDFLNSAEAIIESYRKIIIMTDSDAPGKTAELELARRIGVEKCWRVEYPEGCKDANDVLVKYGKAKLNNLIANAVAFPVEGIYTAMDLKNEMGVLYENGVNRGAPVGWVALDPYYTCKLAEMTIVTGIPGSGKSNFVDAMMINLALMQGWNFAVFSPENWPIQRHIQTLIEKLVEKPFARDGINRDRMSKDEMFDGMEFLNQYFHFIMPPQDDELTVDAILKKAKIAVFRYGIKGLVIDPWNEVEHEFRGLTETQYISQELTKIRRFARLNGLHIWVVAHPRNLSKDENGKYKPPTMYEISGGANWRNKADNGICVHRPDFKTDQTQIFIQKIRFREVGKIGDVSLRYDKDSGQYYEY